MTLDRRSKIRDVWRHPVGHDVLQRLLRQMGRDVNWPENIFVANMPVKNLDRLVGAGFADMLLEMIACEADPQVLPRPDHPDAWWHTAVFYQIYLPSFMDSDHDGVGDLGGVLQRLPYLETLGVDALWIWPLLDTPEGEQGVRDYRQVNEDAGTLEDFEQLMEAAHSRGIKVVMGLDINATSPEHPWFCGAAAGDYYILRKGTPDTPPNNWRWMQSGPAWSYLPDVGTWCLRLGGPGHVDLNWDNPAVREEMQQVLRFWLDKGVDGFCFSSANLLSKSGLEDGHAAAANVLGGVGTEKFLHGPRLHRYLQELREEGMPGPGHFAMGEVWGVGAEMAKLFTGQSGRELDMVLDASHLRQQPVGRRRAKADAAPFDLAELKDYYLRWMDDYGASHWMSLFLETAHAPRMVSRVGANPVYRCILAKMLATWLLTLRGTPILYQGEELGLANTRFASPAELRDPAALSQYLELRQTVGEEAAWQRTLATTADHARTPMPWSAGPRAGFTGAEPWMRLPDGTDHLNATAQMEDAGSVWRFYQRLIALRKKHPCLAVGTFKPVFGRNKKVFCYFRLCENEKWYVEMNLTDKEILRPGRILRSQKLQLSNYEMPARTLRPYEANIYFCE